MTHNTRVNAIRAAHATMLCQVKADSHCLHDINSIALQAAHSRESECLRVSFAGSLHADTTEFAAMQTAHSQAMEHLRASLNQGIATLEAGVAHRQSTTTNKRLRQEPEAEDNNGGCEDDWQQQQLRRP